MVNQLLVENWSRKINYTAFFEECVPEYCIYSVTERPGIVAIATRLIALFGGLNILLKLVAPWIIKIIVLCARFRRGQYIDTLFRYSYESFEFVLLQHVFI